MNQAWGWVVTVLQAWNAVAWMLLAWSYWLFVWASQCFTAACLLRYWWRGRY